MARQARRAANLVSGASLRGLVFDSCFDNRIPHTFGMLRHFGLANRNRVLVSESPALVTAGLATALRIDESEVLMRRYPAHGRGHCSFFGLFVLKARIEDRVRRFSPAAIAAGIHYHPATHELRDLPFSTIGWDMLQDTCPCTDKGVVQNWVTTNGSSRCHSCGGSLGRITPLMVPDDARRSLIFIGSLVDPDPEVQAAALEMLPAAIRNAGRTLLYDMVINLTKVVAGNLDGLDFDTHIAALVRACDAVIQWPTGFAQIERSADCPTYLWEWVRRTYLILDAGNVPPGTQENGSGRANTAANVNYAPSGTAGKFTTQYITAMAAARLGGVDEEALKEAWDDGKLTQHSWGMGSMRVRVFNPAEVTSVAPFLRVTGSRTRAAGYLGLPVYGLEQLLEHGLFSPAPPSVRLKQVAAHLAAAADLTAQIEGARSEIANTVAFVEAMRHVSGRMKPWGAAIEAMLDGDMPFSVHKPGASSPITSRLRVRVDAIPALIELSEPEAPKISIKRADKWAQGDALECLNGNRSAGELLDGLSWSGTSSKKLFPVADVLHRASVGVTTSDLARRFGFTIMRTAMILDANSVGQIAPGLWNRVQAERTICRHAEGRGA